MRTVIKLEHVSKKFSEEQVLKDVCFEFQEGKIYSEEKKKDPFYRLFESGFCYSNACYECRWRDKSNADIRIGDYWGGRFKGDASGVNMVVVMSQKGRC